MSNITKELYDQQNAVIIYLFTTKCSIYYFQNMNDLLK